MILASLILDSTLVSGSGEHFKTSPRPLIIIDPAHGGKDIGVEGLFGHEKFYNLDVAKKVQRELLRAGFQCELTRSEDRKISDEERGRKWRNCPYSILILIRHRGQADGESGCRIRISEELAFADEAGLLAELLAESLVKETGAALFEKGGKNSENSRDVSVPSVEVDCGNLEHPENAAWIHTEAYRKLLAVGMVKGIVSFWENGKKEKWLQSKFIAPADSVLHIPPPISEYFDFPVGIPDGKGYVVVRGFTPDVHPGERWNGIRGGNTDEGDPVCCIGGGVVVFANDEGKGWGNVVITRHGYIDRNGSIKSVDALYAHLGRIDVVEGEFIQRSQQIGTIGRGPKQMYSAHLYFEIRKNLKILMNRSGFEKGYDNYFSPRKFITERRETVTK